MIDSDTIQSRCQAGRQRGCRRGPGGGMRIAELSAESGLSIATIREAVNAIDDPELSLHEVLGTAHRALAPRVEDDGSVELRRAHDDVDRFIRELGWSVGLNAPARR